jgi:hypothetical protein
MHYDSESLYALLPAIHRVRDGAQGEALKELFTVIAEQLRAVEEDIDQLYDNLVIETNIIHGARQAGVAKLLFLGSSCIYPKLAPQPMTEEALLTGLAVLAAVGVLDLGELYVEPTSLVAQAVGGLVFGAGFILGGYCPGTAIAAVATGRKDGIAFALGMLAGVLAYVELTPGIDDWIKANTQGEMTLSSVTGLPMGWFALAFIAFLVFAGWGMKQLETGFGHLRPGG